MAEIYYDTFEGYSIGQSLPWGLLDAFDVSVSSQIQTGGVFNSAQKCGRLSNGQAVYDDGFTYDNATFVYNFQVPAGHLEFYSEFRVLTRDDLDQNDIEFCKWRIEADGTVSIYSMNILKETSGDKRLTQSDWHLIQTEISLTAPGDLISFGLTVYIDGVQWVTYGEETTVEKDETLYNDAVFDRVVLDNRLCLIDEFSVHSPGIGSAVPHPGSPQIRVTKAVVEPIELPTTASVRVTGGLLEIEELPSSAKIRVSTCFIELISERTGSSGGWIVKEA